MALESRIDAALLLDQVATDARSAMDQASQAGFGAIAIGGALSELAPQALDHSGRRHLLANLRSRQLTAASIRVAAPRGSLADPASIDQTVDKTLQAMRLAQDLKAGTVTLYTGPLESSKLSALLEVARHLALEADKAGITLALTTDEPATLQKLLEETRTPHLRGHLETRRLIGSSQTPQAAAELLAGRIGQLTASDAIRQGQQIRPVEFGSGRVDFDALLDILKAQDFHGPMVVDLRGLDSPADAARQAGLFFRGLLQRHGK